jgi:DNA-binding Lrp family transcriptional regulator
MKNSHRSDRETAKAIGVSQPTVTRMRMKLEREGVFKEYTMLPNLQKLGFEIMALTFIKYATPQSPEQLERARAALRELGKAPYEILMISRGMGMGYGGVIISVHRNYTSYVTLRERLAHNHILRLAKIEGFVIPIRDEVQYIPLTFSLLSRRILQWEDDQKEDVKA